jgi:hypothetical protein
LPHAAYPPNGGLFADLIVPDRDFMSCPDADIADTTSTLTVVGGKVVFASGPFAELDTPIPPAMPDWSPVRTTMRPFLPSSLENQVTFSVHMRRAVSRSMQLR